jgi:hypothetical protein
MMDRREWLGQAGFGLLGLTRAAQAAFRIDRPVPFDTPEADAILANMQVFPEDDPWNVDVSSWPTHPRSKAIVATIGVDKPLRYNPDMGFVIVPPDQPRVPVRIRPYAEESDPGPFPLPGDVPIEGWPAWFQRDTRWRGLTLEKLQRGGEGLDGDRHAIVVDPTNHKLYEFFGMYRKDQGWEARQASTFDLKMNKPRPEGWTSADAAGLPIFPAVVRHDELKRGRIGHALRVTVRRSQRAYVAPARHFASRLTDPDLPRMGERLRLRADFDVSRFSDPVRVILTALQRHGMFVADNGLEWAISCAPDPRIPVLHEELRRVKGADFEVVVTPARG